jgi:hypothetical protein
VTGGCPGTGADADADVDVEVGCGVNSAVVFCVVMTTACGRVGDTGLSPEMRRCRVMCRGGEGDP